MTSNEEDTGDSVDITELIEACASALSYAEPFLADPDSFDPLDAMSATQLRDRKMDCCEIPSSRAGAPADATVAPRPRPTGLADGFFEIPWNDLTLDDTAFISLQILVRLQAMICGSSVEESIFTCLYAHRPVLMDMQDQLLEEQFSGLLKDMGPDVLPQQVLLAMSAALLHITDSFRGIVINVDIYEEEDFSSLTSEVFSTLEVENLDTFRLLNGALKANQSQGSGKSKEIVQHCLGFTLFFLTLCTKMAKFSTGEVNGTFEDLQAIAHGASRSLADLRQLVEDQTSSPNTDALLKRVFDPFVNRPLLGNAPIRKTTFKPVPESLEVLSSVIDEVDNMVFSALLKGNSIRRILRVVDRANRESSNILARSMLVLNLYFNDKLLGQHDLGGMIIDDFRQISFIPEGLFTSRHGIALINRLAKPFYETIKLLALNRNRQQAYIDMPMMDDWISLQNEASIVDAAFREESGLSNDTPPVCSYYALSLLLALLDRYLALGLQLRVVDGFLDISLAYWYRHYILSALLNQITLMRKGREPLAATPVQSKTPTKGKKKGGRKSPTKTTLPVVSPVEDENDVHYAILGMRQLFCRAILRFMIALQKAGLVDTTEYEFTTPEKLFARRFEMFQRIRRPAPLSYADYVSGTDASEITQEHLVSSASELFQACRSTVERVLEALTHLDPIYVPISEEECRSLLKVCISNIVFVDRLRRYVSAPSEQPPKIQFDFETHDEFCIIKLV